MLYRQLSTHFNELEFACRHCGQVRVDPLLIDALEKLRGLAQAPITVLDGYRCAQHNDQVPTAAHGSFHVVGQAADVRIAGKTLAEMYSLAMQVGEFSQGGIGLYDATFIHVDVRGHAARWARVQGKYTSIELSGLLNTGPEGAD